MNPIPEFISDEYYNELEPFFDKVAIRNYRIKEMFKSIKGTGGDSIGKVAKAFNISWGTCRGIVYMKGITNRKPVNFEPSLENKEIFKRKSL